MATLQSFLLIAKQQALRNSLAADRVFATELPRLGVSLEGARQVQNGEIVTGLGDRMAIARIARQWLTQGSDPLTPISTAGGGAWKTRDGGQTWLPSRSGVPEFLTTSGSHAGVAYHGGPGVYKTLDGGKTWCSPLGTQQLLAGMPISGEEDRQILAVWLMVALMENV